MGDGSRLGVVGCGDGDDMTVVIGGRERRAGLCLWGRSRAVATVRGCNSHG